MSSIGLRGARAQALLEQCRLRELREDPRRGRSGTGMAGPFGGAILLEAIGLLFALTRSELSAEMSKRGFLKDPTVLLNRLLASPIFGYHSAGDGRIGW